MIMEKRFPRTSKQSRDMWLAAAREILTSSIEHYQLQGHFGPDKEELYTDVAYFGAAVPEKRKNLKKVLTIRSGTHGAEETAGCGIEIDMMDLMAKAQNRFFDPCAPSNDNLSEDAKAIIKFIQHQHILEHDYNGDIGIVMIRAVNPWGAAHITRDDHDFIDNNRCYLPHDPVTGKFYHQLLPLPLESYDKYPHLGGLLVPNSLDDATLDRRHTRLRKILNAEVRADLMRGQYDDPLKIIWGGDGISWSFRTTEKILDPIYANTALAYDNDLHSGLKRKDKPTGSVQMLLLAEEDGPIHQKIRRDLQECPMEDGGKAADIHSLFGTKSVSTWVEGSAEGWLRHKYANSGKTIVPCGIEMGPKDGVELIDLLDAKGLRTAARLLGDTHPKTAEIKQRLHDYFCPDDLEFERNAKADMRRIFRYQLYALAA